MHNDRLRGITKYWNISYVFTVTYSRKFCSVFFCRSTFINLACWYSEQTSREGVGLNHSSFGCENFILPMTSFSGARVLPHYRLMSVTIFFGNRIRRPYEKLFEQYFKMCPTIQPLLLPFSTCLCSHSSTNYCRLFESISY